ncbi:zinc dependent phospholipase C family protein [Shewanella woodyi]|uniref:zinc dependent phospholipase C family protein n=1 Tax=Shewanella woodyi TaxID=60961 RepID=UPI0007EB2F6B|nr:zinc dependent phospholipase C family protein [Shewanella woodyi]
MRLFIGILVTIQLLIFSEATMAYKIETHVWIGQQLINDLQDDGKISLELNGELVKIAVPVEVKTAILAYQDAYLLGHIGPDAAPDILVGQSIIHPGEGAWDSAQWMGYLLNESRNSEQPHVDLLRAYSYGFLGHASADVFGHTYVNKYAGDQFSLEDETLVEIRHIALESYISERTPTIKNNNNQTWSSANSRVNISDEYADTIRDVMVYNETVQEVYSGTPYGKHLAAYWDYRQQVDDIAEAGIWHEIDKWIVQIAASAWLDVDLSGSEASDIVNAVQPVLDVLNGPVIDGLQDASNEMFAISEKFNELEISSIKHANDAAKSAEAKLLSTKHQIEENALRLDRYLRDAHCEILDASFALDPTGVTEWLFEHDPLLNFVSGLFGFSKSEPLPPRIYSWTGTKSELTDVLDEMASDLQEMYNDPDPGNCSGAGRPDEICPVVRDHQIRSQKKQMALISFEVSLMNETETSTIVYKVYDGQTSAGSTSSGNFCTDLNDLIDDAHKNILKEKQRLDIALVANHQEYRNKVLELKVEMLAASVAANDVANAFIDLGQVVSLDVSPIQALLRGWRGDLDSAMSAYIKANGQVMLNSTDENTETIEPLVTWFKCYHAQILGIPSAIGNACEGGIVGSTQNLIESLHSIVTIVQTLTTPPGVLSSVKMEVNKLKEETVDRLTSELKDKVSEELTELIPEKYQEVIAISAAKVNDNELNYYFTIPERGSNKNLLMIPDMAHRVKLDMKLREGEHDFNPSQFAAINNTLILAKLSLLDSLGLNELASLAGLPTNAFSEVDNIMASSFSNLDGNHQWMEKAPPLPNSIGSYYGNDGSYSTQLGFIPWRPQHRDKLFNKLFKGPMTPNLDVMFSGNSLAGSSYPYQVCSVNPFPADLLDKKCLVSVLIPILSGMLN